MWHKLRGTKLLVGVMLASMIVVGLACSSADEPSAPAAPAAPAAPQQAAPAAPAPAAPAPAPAAPSSAPAASTAPAPAAATAVPAAPAPSTGAMADAPKGTLTIAVGSVNSPNGLPRFCTAGCAETIYISGITETLFNSIATPDGQATTEPLLALDFTLDPSLEFGDFACCAEISMLSCIDGGR